MANSARTYARIGTARHALATRETRSNRFVTDPRHAVEQAAPLRVNVLGAAVLPVWVAWNPMVTAAPGAMVAL